MKLIELTQNRVAVVDDEDFEWLSKWIWTYYRDKEKRTGYARRRIGTYPYCRIVSMHTAVLKQHGRWRANVEVDHQNGCGCDNRKSNLRLGTSDQNKRNKKCYSNNTSKVTGVSWSTRWQKWRAYISPPGVKRPKHLGWFIYKKDAIAARRQAEIEHFGEYRHNPKDLCPLWKTGQCPDCAKRAKELGLKL